MNTNPLTAYAKFKIEQKKLEALDQRYDNYIKISDSMGGQID